MTAPLHIACLCAAWCRACEAYRPVFEAAVAALAPAAVPRWIDVEDEADLVGDWDVETFPTLLVYDAAAAGPVHFAGPVLPDTATLQRLVRAAQAGMDNVVPIEPGALALAQRLRTAAAGPRRV